MDLSTSTGLRTSAAAGLFAVLLAGCGGAGTGDEQAASPTGAATGAPTAGTDTPEAPEPTEQPTASLTEVAGGAFGFRASVSLFGGEAMERGPEPTVSLPDGGATDPVTASAPSGTAVYGPATLLESGRLQVSTEGTTGSSGFVTSTSTLADVGPGPLTIEKVSSSCRVDGRDGTAEVELQGGQLVVSEGADPDDSSDDEIVDLPARPEPGTSFEGTMESVGDSFRVVLNEQKTSRGGITVNAVHLQLLGPTAKGDLILAQSRCSGTSSPSPPAGG